MYLTFHPSFHFQIATYFWFLGDLFIVCFFAISFTTAYRYIHMRRKLEDSRLYTEPQIQQKIQRSIYKHVMCKYDNLIYLGFFQFIKEQFRLAYLSALDMATTEKGDVLCKRNSH